MIIGISGKMKTGKDTAAEYFKSVYPGMEFQNKKFAGKLKEITAMLIGCDLADLENQDFKTSRLPSEWDVINVYSGIKKKVNPRPFSSKESAQKFIDDINFANKAYTESVGGNKDALTGYFIQEDYRTPRDILQLLGTEAGRQIIHPNIWVNSFFADYKYICPNGCTEECRCAYAQYPNWIITDCRFPNEAQAIKDRGGVIIRINRLFKQRFPEWESLREVKHKDEALYMKLTHPSETGLDDYKGFDYVVNSGSTVEELHENLSKIPIFK